MMDLSFLTGEEQQIILAVLKRDATLKKAEEKRVHNLQKMVRDSCQLKYLTGEWFYETKQLRHQDRIHGADIIRASMKHVHKPVTTWEFSKIFPKGSRFACSSNKGVFNPPGLCGFLHQPPSSEGYPNPYEILPDYPKPVIQSPTKRKKTFNKEPAPKKKDSHLLAATADQMQTSRRRTSSSPDSCISWLSNLRQDAIDCPPTQNASVPVWGPENRAVSPGSLDRFEKEDEDRGRQTNSAFLRGILKCLSPSSTLFSQLDLTASVSQDSPTETWMDRKQERFLRHSLVDSEEEQETGRRHSFRNEERHHSQAEASRWTSRHGVISAEVTADVLPSPHGSADSLSQGFSLKPRLPGIFRKDKEKTAQSSSEEGLGISQLEEPVGTQRHPDPTWDRPAGFKEDTKPPPMTEVRTLQLTALQNMSFKETVTSVDVDTQQEATKSRAAPFQERLYSLKAFWERDKRPKTESTTEELDTADTSWNKSLSPQMGRSLLSKEDGTYRANPVLIYEEIDEALTTTVTELHITETQSNSGPQEDKAKMSRVKVFWEKCFSSDSPVDVQSAGQVKADTASQDRPVGSSKTQLPRSKEQDDEVRRSPSKTCHPKALPRESTGKGPRLQGSPLKTFPIDINPRTGEHQGKLRQMKSASPPPSYCPHVDSQLQKSTTLPLPKKISEKKLGTFSHFARSFIPQDPQHYLGPQEKAHCPPFHCDQAAAESHAGQSALTDVMRNQSAGPTEASPSRISSWFMQKKDRTSSQDAAPRAWYLPRSSAASYGGSPTSITSALNPFSSRSMCLSRSAENLTSQTKGKTQTNSKDKKNLSVDDGKHVVLLLNIFIRTYTDGRAVIQTFSSFPASFFRPMKSSASVPILLHHETDTDFFETDYGYRRKTSSSMSNLSLSSGMASMSSASGSISSIYHGDFGDIEVQGSIQFAVNYIQKLAEFHIFVVLCRDLAVADTKKNRSDPYVKCFLLPDKSKLGKRKTTIKKKTLNPTYNEILRFKIQLDVLKTQNLNISVWHHDTFGRNSFLGEVDQDLSEWDFSNTQMNEYPLKARVSAQASSLLPAVRPDGTGYMRVALRFLAQTTHSKKKSRTETGEVQIWVKDCKNLPPVRGGIIDPFVKCTVLPDTSRKSRQKTRVVKRTASPMFNHTMVYDGFRTEDLKEACAEITVWGHDRLHNHYIGGVRLGLGTGKSYGVDVAWMDSTTEEATLWQRMSVSDDEWVEDVLPLRMLVMAKNMSK
ncbi:synaptotagmin-like protein 2 isoform X1 [Brachyistius frenatus]|uniref:synaptotagmin-like protein 2 isoform X1 n=1 Tax=Brachyistius frenatus TaxID=100188 RepID=UPI0037E7C85F